MARKYVKEIDGVEVVLGPHVIVEGTPVASESDSASDWRTTNGFTEQKDVNEGLPASDDVTAMTVRERTGVLQEVVKLIRG